MQTTHNTILITGGGTGIGLAMAAAFLEAGNTVIICGRRADKLAEAKAAYPALHTRTTDLADAAEREVLVAWAFEAFPALNIIINNAGVQSMIDFTLPAGSRYAPDAATFAREITTNIEAPVHIAALAYPHLARTGTAEREAAIMNVTSGLAFVPLAAVPVYSATKAALHSFTLSLRHQLRDTTVRVFEIAPPIVDTDLDKGARDDRQQHDRGISPAAVATATLEAMAANQYECLVGMAQWLYESGHSANVGAVFARMNG